MAPIIGIVASGITGNLANYAWDSIATYSAGATSVITFNSIPSTYKHLRIVARLKDNRAVPYSGTSLSFNGAPSGTNYAYTWIYADSRTNNAAPYEDSSGGTNSIALTTVGNATYTTPGTFAFTVLDIFDYQNTSKATTVYGASGYVDMSGGFSIKNQVAFSVSGTWSDTTTVSSISLTSANPNYDGSVRVGLYGIKG